MSMSLRTLVFLLLATVIAACGSAPLARTATPTPTAVPVDTALIERGVEVYRANYCGACHTLEAANTRGTFGPAHNTAMLDAVSHITLSTYYGEATDAETYLRESILNPTIFYTPGYETTNHHMPAFTHLLPEDIDALVYLLLNQRAD